MSVLDEVLLRDSDSESGRVVKPSVVHRTGDLEEKLEAQITICLEAFNKLDLGSNLDIFKANVRRQIKGSFQAFKPPTDPLKILLNVSLNCACGCCFRCLLFVVVYLVVWCLWLSIFVVLVVFVFKVVLWL